MPSAATISAVIASWVSVPQVSRSPKRLSHNRSNSPITANRCPAARFSARAASRNRCVVDSNIRSIMAEGSDRKSQLFDDRDRLPRALPNRFLDLLLVFGSHFVLQHGQRVVILQPKNLRYYAHAHAVAFAQTPVDFNLLCHSAHLIATPSPGHSASRRHFA